MSIKPGKRLAAEVLMDYAIFGNLLFGNAEAKALRAGIFEQMGCQAEAGTGRKTGLCPIPGTGRSPQN
ncbi:hypothetical protein DZK27_09960 [Rhodobacteraceae bacterium 63075]|nr:hypothetical protein DZK27_09960 [Rhodobacteraceae bacterium 63075]